MTEIVEVKDFIPAYTDAVQKLLEQLTNRPVKLTGTTLREIISQENTHLFFLLADQEIAGMLTVGIYHSPTGGKAWIEDVVVDEKYRGQGLSKQLVTHAVRFVKEQGIPLIMLTSNPTRIAANKLYQKLGFEQKQPWGASRSTSPRSGSLWDNTSVSSTGRGVVAVESEFISESLKDPSQDDTSGWALAGLHICPAL